MAPFARTTGRGARTVLGGTLALALAAALPLAIPRPAYADSTGMSATVSDDCTNGRVQVVLNNQTTASQTFTVSWPGSGGGPWVRTLSAGGNSLLYFTRPVGTAYSFTTTTPTGFSNTQSGTVGCGLASGTPQMDQTQLISTSTVIQGLNSSTGTPYNGTVASVRIPSMAVTDDGTVIAVADARVSNSDDLPNNIQLAMTRSTDGGTSWTAPSIVVHAPSTTEGTGDSSLLVDRTDNRVFLFYNYGPAGIGFNSPASGSNATTDTGSLHVEFVTSDDDGVTWSAPTDLNPEIKDPTWGSLFASSGHGIQLASGRLVQPIVYRDSAGTDHAADIYSDDDGVTWHTGASAGTNVNESKAIQRSDGDVVQDMRANAGATRYDATSTDGSTTFGAMAANGLPDPGCNGDEISYLKPTDVSSTGAPLTTATALFSNNASTSARVNLTVRLSTDDGAGWPNSSLLVPGTAGYSTTAVLGDGSVGDLYEVGNTGGVFFDHFTLGWVEAS